MAQGDGFQLGEFQGGSLHTQEAAREAHLGRGVGREVAVGDDAADRALAAYHGHLHLVRALVGGDAEGCHRATAGKPGLVHVFAGRVKHMASGEVEDHQMR